MRGIGKWNQNRTGAQGVTNLYGASSPSSRAFCSKTGPQPQPRPGPWRHPRPPYVWPPKPRGLSLRARSPAWPAGNGLFFPIPYHPPLSLHRGDNGPLNRAFLGPPTPQWGMKSTHARLPSHIPGTARLSPRHVRRGTAPPVAFARMMGVTLARSLSRGSVALHRTPRPTRSTRPGLAITPPHHTLLRCYCSAWRPTATLPAVGAVRLPSPRDLRRRPTVAPLPMAPCYYPLTPWASQPAHLHGTVARHIRRRNLVRYPAFSDSHSPALTTASTASPTPSPGTPTPARNPDAARFSLNSASPSLSYTRS